MISPDRAGHGVIEQIAGDQRDDGGIDEIGGGIPGDIGEQLTVGGSKQRREHDIDKALGNKLTEDDQDNARQRATEACEEQVFTRDAEDNAETGGGSKGDQNKNQIVYHVIHLPNSPRAATVPIASASVSKATFMICRKPLIS